MTIFRGDNTGAFGQSFLSINATLPNGYEVSKADFKCGKIFFEFTNPTFPISITLTESQTSQLSSLNNCYLAVYDTSGRKQTCTGTLQIETNESVI